MARYRFVGSHADSLGSGRPIEPGEVVDLTKEDEKDPVNQRLIEEEQLIEAAPEESKTSSKGKEE